MPHGDLSIWIIHPNSHACAAFSQRFSEFPRVSILQQRFEELPAHDCFVTAGNAFGIMTAGIDAAVVGFFGPEIMRRVQDHILDQYLGEQPIGTAFILPTHHKHCPHLVHAPTMRVPGSIERTDKVYCATWAALLAVHQHNLANPSAICTVAFPALGTGFGGVAFDEAARQMAAAYAHYLEPPVRMDWDFVARRQKAICYDGAQQVVRG